MEKYEQRGEDYGQGLVLYNKEVPSGRILDTLDSDL
jgi:hypothetical protein